MVAVTSLIRGSILEVTGYRNAHPPPPQPLCSVVGVVFFDSEKIMFLDFFDMYLIVFVILSQYLVITLLIRHAIIAVTVTDSGNRD